MGFIMHTIVLLMERSEREKNPINLIISTSATFVCGKLQESELSLFYYQVPGKISNKEQ